MAALSQMLMGSYGGRGPAALIDRTAGTNIGNLTENGGLAVIFDGNSSQDNPTSARLTAATSAYAGKTMAVPTAIDSVSAYGTNASGFAGGGGDVGTVTLTLYGKQGAAPASATDGTSIGSTNFADATNAARVIDCTDKGTYWDHVWVRVQYGSAVDLRMAELEMTGWQ